MFILTDGYSSEESRLASTLQYAGELDVEVTAISVGHEYSNIHNVYQNYIKIAASSDLATALEILKSGEGGQCDEDLEVKRPADELENLDDILQKEWKLAVRNAT